MGKSITGRVLAAALLFLPLLVQAAGLGNLKVLSALGQPLNAQIEIVSEQTDEWDSFTAHLASQEAFSRAGIDFNPVLLGLTINIERLNGKAVLYLRTKQPVNEPFLDMLIELQWSSGKLVREYTFLLDPAEYKGPQPIAAAPPPPAPVAAAPVERPVEQPAPPVPAVEEKPIAAMPAPAPAPASAPAPAAAPKPTEKTYEVKKGDTLGEIARRYMGTGVTYNQMLIALFRANREAFIHDNVNLVRAGHILNIPGQDEPAAVDPEEAKLQVQQHMAEFAEYRRKLAAAAAAAKPAGESAGQQSAAGRITQEPAEPAPQAPSDQLKLSKAEPGKPAGAAGVAAREDDRIARERALQEAQSRVGELEKNVADLQKLLELKNQQLAEMEKKAAEQPPAPAAPAAPAKAPEALQAQPPASQPSPQVATAPEPPKAAPPEPAKPPATEAKPRPRPKAVPPPPPPPPSLVDELLDNPLALGGIGGIVLLLLGYGAWAWQRKKSTQARFQDSVSGGEPGGAAGSSAFNPQDQQPGGVPSQASVSQASVGGMGAADEVDPIAEADVYMAYGRDAQAEEILKEALQKDASRAAVHAKLLEIYAGRRDTAAFEQTALKLKGLSGGAGPEWEKAMTLGRSIDPQNGLYGGSGSADMTTPPAAARAAPQAAAPTLDFDLDSTQGRSDSAPNVDFDLGTGTHDTVPSDQSAFSAGGTLKMRMGKEEASATTGLDFDLGGDEQAKPADAGLDFELPSTISEQPSATKAAVDTTGSIDFDLDLDTQGSKAGPETSAAQPTVDLSSISLDLGGASDSLAPATQTDPKWQEVATKLDLAKAYEDMGDKDGARELLNEVMKEGDPAQKGQAQEMLASLG